ncbi:MAG: Rieske (2Fe-2S) protein [Alicyclobacillus sp.]|nr:Rieske (2Fe-2S) protein [Alicyclobacillus sp.]
MNGGRLGVAEHFVGTLADFARADRKLVTVEGKRIGVFRVQDTWVAYENVCVHQGGPVCEGQILGKVEAVLAPDKSVLEERFSESERHLVCPWHGWEFDLATGVSAGERRLALHRFDVRVKGEEVFVVVGND